MRATKETDIPDQVPLLHWFVVSGTWLIFVFLSADWNGSHQGHKVLRLRGGAGEGMFKNVTLLPRI